MLYLYTESVSVYAVLGEGVFVAESDDVFREEGANGDAHVVRVGSNDDFLQISTCGPTAPNLANPAFRRRGHVWSPLRNPMVPSLILGLMHDLRAHTRPMPCTHSSRAWLASMWLSAIALASSHKCVHVSASIKHLSSSGTFASACSGVS